jgi:hypothetical protein
MRPHVPLSALVLALILAVSAIVSEGTAQERVVLNVPVYVSPGVQTFRVRSLLIQRGVPTGTENESIFTDGPKLIATLVQADQNGVFVAGGKTLQCIYVGAQAETLTAALNRADLSTTSLERRIITRCQIDGKLGAGTIQGAPQ